MYNCIISRGIFYKRERDPLLSTPGLESLSLITFLKVFFTKFSENVHIYLSNELGDCKRFPVKATEDLPKRISRIDI